MSAEINSSQRTAIASECKRLRALLQEDVAAIEGSESDVCLPEQSALRVALRANATRGPRTVGRIYISDNGRLVARVPDEEALRLASLGGSSGLGVPMSSAQLSDDGAQQVPLSEHVEIMRAIGETLLQGDLSSVYGLCANHLECAAITDARVLSCVVELRIKAGDLRSADGLLEASARRFLDQGDRRGLATVLRLAAGRYDGRPWLRDVMSCATDWDREISDIAGVPVLASLPRGTLVHAAKRYPPLVCAANDILLKKGEHSGDLLAIRRGHLRIYLDVPAGDPDRVRFPGEVVGEHGAFAAWCRATGGELESPMGRERGAWVLSSPGAEIWRFPESTVVAWLSDETFRKAIGRLARSRMLDSYFARAEWLHSLVGTPSQLLRNTLGQAVQAPMELATGETLVGFRRSLDHVFLIASGGLTEISYHDGQMELRCLEPGAICGLDEVRLGRPGGLWREIRANQETIVLPVALTAEAIRDLHIAWE